MNRESPNAGEPKLSPQLQRVLLANELIEICPSNPANPVGNSYLMLEHGQVLSLSIL